MEGNIASGKSTTLNCIAGLLDATTGKITARERNITTLPPKDRNIGMVFQSYALYPHLKVIDNIAFPLKQKKVPKEERHTSFTNTRLTCLLQTLWATRR